MEEKLVKFINDNSLSFNGEGSQLNGNCTVISGYADFLGVDDVKTIKNAIKVTQPTAKKYVKELEKVWDFAYSYNYGNYWKTPEAKRMYKF